MTRSAVVHGLREVTLTAGAVLGVLCLVVTLAGLTFGVRPLVFQSGSMAPTIRTGDLALSRTVPAAELHRGDIVSVLDGSGSRLTHRVVNVAVEGDQRQLTLQGDANDEPDTEAYTVTDAERVLFHVPRLGYVIGWLTGPIGIFLLGLYAALLLSVAFRRDRPKGPGPSAPTQKRRGRRRAGPDASKSRRRRALVVAMAAGGMVALGPASPSWAAWTDAVTLSATSFTAYTVPRPGISCSDSGQTATITWNAVTTPHSLTYTATLDGMSGQLPVTGTGLTRSVQVSTGLLGSLLGDTRTLNIQGQMPAGVGNGWKSVVAVQTVRIGILGLSLTCGTSS